jgi:adhesin/invasin
VRSRLVILVALVLTAVAVAGAGLSTASYTTASSTAVQASTAQLTSDTLSVNTGNNQTATVGTAVATAPSVRVTDINGNPVAGVSVTFSVAAGGGSVTGATSTTNASGIAAVGSWTLGTNAGANSLTASSPGLSGSPATFTATGTPGAGSKYFVTVSSYSPVAGSAVTVSAQLADSYGNLVTTPGVSVTWSKTGAGGSFGANPTSTDANGIAQVSFTTGTVSGTTYAVTAASPGASGTSPTLTTVTGAAAVIVISAGTAQTATVGTAVATAPSVLVTDAHSNPVTGVSVSFAVASGGGSITGATATTNASGIAAVGSWTLGTTAGTNTLTASSAGLAGSPVTFSATGTAGTPSKYVVTASTYSPVAGSTVAITAQLADQYGNAVATSGIAVTFTKTPTASGSLSGTNPANTNASGVATINLVTGTAAGVTYTVTAASTGRTGTSPNIVTVAGTATKISANAGNGQSATVGTAVATPPSVLVTDANNNPVAGVAVTFAVTGGGGSVTGPTSTTNASGIAAAGNWTLGTTPGTNTLTATSAGLSGSPVTFTATGLLGAAAKYAVTSSNYSPAAGANVTISAQLTDQYGNPVATSGITVTWSKVGTGGSLSTATSTTNGSGIATVTLTTGTTAGVAYTVTATDGSSRTGTTPTITTVAGAASKYVVTASTYAPVAGSQVTVWAQLTDQYGNAVASGGISVTWSKTGGGGSFSSNPTATNSSGLATVTFTTAAVKGRTYSIKATDTSSRTGTCPNIVTQ